MHDRLEAAYDYLRGQLTEGSTINGVVTLLTLAGGALAKWPPVLTLFAATTVSQLVKITLPDDIPEWLHLPKWKRQP